MGESRGLLQSVCQRRPSKGKDLRSFQAGRWSQYGRSYDNTTSTCCMFTTTKNATVTRFMAVGGQRQLTVHVTGVKIKKERERRDEMESHNYYPGRLWNCNQYTHIDHVGVTSMMTQPVSMNIVLFTAALNCSSVLKSKHNIVVFLPIKSRGGRRTELNARWHYYVFVGLHITSSNVP